MWVADEAPRRNQFVRFERRFDLPGVPGTACLHLFADTRYRLRVNGRFVATGPGRFVTQHPEFDTHDLATHLQVGLNVISVEVNFYGASSYQSMPDGEPGFIAWGEAGGEDLATPGAWKAFRLEAWRADAPAFSFAQGPVEICDTRRLDGLEKPVILCQGTGAPWGNLRPYSGPAIPFSIIKPKRLELAGPLRDDEVRYGFMTDDPDHVTRGLPGAGPKPWVGFATWIHSPTARHVELGVFWSNLLLNGHSVPVDTSTPLGNHGRVRLDLQKGWNLLTGEVEVLTGRWAYLLSVPRGLEISLHATADLGDRAPLSRSPVMPREQLRLPAPGDRQPPEGWTAHDGNADELTPSRMMAWDQPGEHSLRNLPVEQLASAGRIEARAATWSFSFAGEFLGHLEIEVEAPPGSTLDVASDDWQRADGVAALYQSHPFADTADRFILRGGRQTVLLFHPRGGKLVQITLRVPGQQPAAPLTLHGLQVFSRLSLGADATRFDSDHPVMNWAWPVGLRTLLSSTDEAYSDCPWRERGSYIGDSLVNVHLHAIHSGDFRVAARTLRIFGQAQLPNGQLACCAPAWLRRPHEDFTLLWIIALRDYAEFSGDLDLLREMGPVIDRIWSSPTWESHASGLWNANGRRLFIDWGVLPGERAGEGNAVLNLLRVAARKACADMARLLGETRLAILHEEESKRVEKAIFAQLWDSTQQRLRPYLHGSTPALHANILALSFDLGTAEQRASLLAYVEPLLQSNLGRGLEKGQFSGHLELYYLFFALPALARHGRPDLAERLITEHYGYLMEIGDDTLPESFARVDRCVGSRCHSWSGAATVYAARYVLGVRPGPDGAWIFDPRVYGLKRAAGRIAHPKGWIEVAWTREADGIRAEIKAPPGLTIRHAASHAPATV